VHAHETPFGVPKELYYIILAYAKVYGVKFKWSVMIGEGIPSGGFRNIKVFGSPLATHKFTSEIRNVCKHYDQSIKAVTRINKRKVERFRKLSTLKKVPVYEIRKLRGKSIKPTWQVVAEHKKSWIARKASELGSAAHDITYTANENKRFKEYFKKYYKHHGLISPKTITTNPYSYSKLVS